LGIDTRWPQGGEADSSTANPCARSVAAVTPEEHQGVEPLPREVRTGYWFGAAYREPPRRSPPGRTHRTLGRDCFLLGPRDCGNRNHRERVSTHRLRQAHMREVQAPPNHQGTRGDSSVGGSQRRQSMGVSADSTQRGEPRPQGGPRNMHVLPNPEEARKKVGFRFGT